MKSKGRSVPSRPTRLPFRNLRGILGMATDQEFSEDVDYLRSKGRIITWSLQQLREQGPNLSHKLSAERYNFLVTFLEEIRKLWPDFPPAFEIVYWPDEDYVLYRINPKLDERLIEAGVQDDGPWWHHDRSWKLLTDY